MYRAMCLLVMTVATSFAQARYTDAMYRKAIIEESTAPLYVLFTFHDAKTGRDRVICTLGNFLVGAIHMEYRLDYDKAGRLVAIELLDASEQVRTPQSVEFPLGAIV